ncbi:ABC transporter substrate-binding protein [Streptomyces sp. NPDC092296]|uniref:ABC transporter substrate-binding protein n=1 Tax=Streptomyces sp. NPDC092296 TaxID=3366012 RepID=UPI00381DA052
MHSTKAAPLTGPALDARFAEIVASLGRRGLLAGAGGLALAALTGCGEGSPAAPVGSESATRTLRGADGEVTVPTHPRRVVCLDYFTAIFLVELGLPPVGGIDFSWVDDTSMYPAYVAPLRAVKPIGEITKTDIERVAALRPDLVLGPKPGSRYDNSPGAMKKAAALAPVFAVDFGNTGDWRGPLADTARAVNRTAEHDRLKAAYQADIQRVRAAHGDLLARTRVGVLSYAQDGTYALDLPDAGDGVILRDLGLAWGRASAANGSNNRELSLEELGRLDDCDLLLYRADSKGVPGNGLDAVTRLPAWRRLPAVRAGHAYPIGWNDVCGYRWAQQAVADFEGAMKKYTGGV